VETLLSSLSEPTELEAIFGRRPRRMLNRQRQKPSLEVSVKDVNVVFGGKGGGHCAPPARDRGTAFCHSAALGRPTSSWRWNCRTAATQVSRDRNCWKERLAATIHLHVSLSCTSIQNQPSMEIATNVTANYTVRPAG